MPRERAETWRLAAAVGREVGRPRATEPAAAASLVPSAICGLALSAGVAGARDSELVFFVRGRVNALPTVRQDKHLLDVEFLLDQLLQLIFGQRLAVCGHGGMSTPCGRKEAGGGRAAHRG